MWKKIKSIELDTWVVITFVGFAIVLIGFGISYL